MIEHRDTRMEHEKGPYAADDPGGRKALAPRRVALGVSSFASFLTAFMASAVNVALPALQKEFQMNAIALGWVAMALLLSAAMCVVPFGRAADIYGRKRFFTYGISIFTVASLLCGVSGSATTLIAFRFVQGIGAAMVFATGIAIITSVYPLAERGRALGLSVAAVYFGLSSGPFFGGFLTAHLGWRSVFLIIAPLGILVVAVTKIWLKTEWTEARGEKFDFSGSMIYCLSLLLVIYGFSRLPGLLGFLVLGGGILAGFMFVKWESRVKMPILNINLLRINRVFAFSNLAALIHYAATYAVTFLLSLYLQYVRGLEPQHAGAVLVCQPLVQVFLSPFIGRLSDKVEPRIVASAGMGMTAVSLVLFSLLTATTSLALVLANLVLLGTGFAFFATPNASAIMGSVEKRLYGVGSGILATSRMVGQVFSMGFTLLVFAALMGTSRISPAIYPLFLRSAKLLFVFFALLCLGAVAASLARGNVKTP
jgi:EmrB/QacA subfamily drug resistance transporter